MIQAINAVNRIDSNYLTIKKTTTLPQTVAYVANDEVPFESDAVAYAQSPDGDTVEISEEGMNKSQTMNDTSSESTETTDDTSDASAYSLYQYSEYQLSQMLTDGDISTAEYIAELIRREKATASSVNVYQEITRN